jgi:sulfatase modifying factor 1
MEEKMRVTKLLVWIFLWGLIVGFILSSEGKFLTGDLPGMVFVKGGTFIMGADDNETDEKPIHDVTLDSFYMGKYEVTQKEWNAVMGNNPSFFNGANNPVEKVDWYDAIAYCNRRSKMEKLTPCYSGSGDNITCNFDAEGYRLPTEAEWEYACRGGSQTGNFTYSGSDNIDDVAWYEGNSGGKPHPVGQKKPNELGIHDMSGNIWEWCWEWYDANYYKNSPSTNPRGPESGKERSYRGGGCCGRQEYGRCTGRYKLEPAYKHSDMGFRVVKKSSGKIPEGMILVAGGTVKMGSSDGKSGLGPAHRVSLNSFYIGKFEVTQEEWTTVMGNNVSFTLAAKNPVDCVRWYEAIEYCNRRSIMEGLEPCYSGSDNNITCNFRADGYRLPTEAEWEYACRGGVNSQNFTYSGSNDADEAAWHKKTALNGQTQAVGLKKPNELGIYDMTGNAWEWCWDRYDRHYYKKSPPVNPGGPSTGVRRVLRSGSMEYPAFPITARFGAKPINGFIGFGFRVVRNAANEIK